MKALGLSFIAVAATLAPLVACGGGGNSDGTDVTVPDAKPTPDAPVTPDATVLPPGCDYAEQNDSGNSTGNTPEATQLNVTGKTVLCGKLNNGHFQAPTPPATDGVIDLDFYTLDLAADSDVFVSLTGTGLDTPAAGSEVDYLIGQPDPMTMRLRFDLGGALYGDHVAGATHLAAGTYYVVVGNFGTADAASSFDYKATIKVEPTPVCPAGAGNPTFAEAADGASSTGNDVINITTSSSGTPPTMSTAYTLTAVPNDVAEASGITLAAGSSTKLTGTSSAQNVVTTDDYYDGDTYEFTTGATTNQMRVRMNWPATAPVADIDLFLFEKPAGSAALGRPVGLAATADPEEYNAFSLKPNTTYWIYVGGYKNTTTPAADGFPRTYTVQMCGETFAP